MKRSILALASGAFILGAAEFVMMGILPQTAAAMQVSIPAAGHYISAYAIGVCVGTLILVFGRKVPPKNLIILFMHHRTGRQHVERGFVQFPHVVGRSFHFGLAAWRVFRHGHADRQDVGR